MNDTAEAAYDSWHIDLAKTEQGGDAADSPWHLMAKKHLGDLAGLAVLEIGCGRGGFSKYLLDKGANLVAADFSTSAVNIAKTLLSSGPPCDVRVADIQDIPFGADHFDLVVSLETLEHVPDPEKGLSELVRVAKPGGRLIITTPNYFGGLGLYRWYREWTGKGYSEVGQPINNKTTLKGRARSLRGLGCSLDAIDGCGHYLYVPGRNPVRMAWMDQAKPLTKWFGAHSMTVATKRRV